MCVSYERALVVLSGGADSTICLFWAKQYFKEVHALTFNYGQRHIVELQSAMVLASMAGLKSHEILDVGPILKSTSPLVDRSRLVTEYNSVAGLPGGLEDTFIPGRNILFLTLAANRAYVLTGADGRSELGATALVTGLCQEDSGGYPDCRLEFVEEMIQALSLGLYGAPFDAKNKVASDILTPLMNLTKAQSIVLATSIPGAMKALAYSHTCYNGRVPPCGRCHACLLRARGFAEAGVEDPLILRLKGDGKLPADYPGTGLVEGTVYAKEVACA